VPGGLNGLGREEGGRRGGGSKRGGLEGVFFRVFS
jgi:hypothetical protein